MDIYALDSSDSFSAYDNNGKDPIGYDPMGRELKNLTCNPYSHILLKPMMSKPDRTEGKITGSWDEERAFIITAAYSLSLHPDKIYQNLPDFPKGVPLIHLLIPKPKLWFLLFFFLFPRPKIQ